MEWHIIGILAFVVIYNIWRYYHEDDGNEYCPVVTDTSDNNQVKKNGYGRNNEYKAIGFEDN